VTQHSALESGHCPTIFGSRAGGSTLAERRRSGSLVRPGAALKGFRTERGLTLADVAQRTGLPVSTLSKIENGKMELTVDKLLRITLAFDINVADLLGAPASQQAGQASRRRSITRAGEGKAVHSPYGSYSYQGYELLNKSITPMIAEITCRSLEQFGPFHRHKGEEFVYVISGELALYTDSYTPAYLKAGDTIFFDSEMGHAYVAVGDEPCRILSVFSTPDNEPLDLVELNAPDPSLTS
jgi:transcriptional regulator with XRE-family HTH domain